MNDTIATAGRRPLHLWIIGIVALLWTAMGAFDYLATQLQLEFYMSEFTEEQLEYFYGFPAWVTFFWALGVWGAFFGSVALLAASRWAVALYAISLAGLIVSSVYTLMLSDGLAIMGSAGAVFSAVIFIIQVFLLVYARRMTGRGVLH
ncbi:MAG: hypothetical protein R3323_02280 [Wenzhouxiangellaceae bacterium]|nr:hypothetical protein [Wenzhouxiangellaceae bacterium]